MSMRQRFFASKGISESWSQNVDDSNLTLKMSLYRGEKFSIVPDSFAGIEFDRAL